MTLYKKKMHNWYILFLFFFFGGNTREDHVRNEYICRKVGVAPFEDELRRAVSDGLAIFNVDLRHW